MWNQNLLQETARLSLKGRKLIVVSCRAPFIHEYRNGSIECISPAGGVTAALKPVLSALGGAWIAVGSGSADRATASRRGRLQVPPDRPSFTLRRVFLPEDLHRGHYEGASNRMLWPMCHMVFRRPVLSEQDWQAYRRVNEIFAEAILEEADGHPAVVFIQDYQFALLPRMLKARNPALTVGQFWHIPFPGFEMLRTFPWAAEVLDGLLGNDVLGFHLPQHCANFSQGVEELIARQGRRFGNSLWLGEHATHVCDAPIGIDYQSHAETAASAEVDRAMETWRARLGGVRHIGIGIDRIDYTKGIPERIRALAALFEAEPSLRGALSFVQIGVPSRTGIAEYAELDHQIESEANALNARFGSESWKPLILERRNLPPVEMMALHRLARFCMVTPLHDGMNLVAKEYVASRFDEDGVLILSRFAGSARELDSSVLVNPFSQQDLMDGVRTALAMSAKERRRRMIEARAAVQQNNVYCWAGGLLEKLGRHSAIQLRRNQPLAPAAAVSVA